MYDGVTPFEPVVSDRTYNIGQVGGGQFFVWLYGWKYAQANAMNPDLIDSSHSYIVTFCWDNFNYFGSNINNNLPIFYNPNQYISKLYLWTTASESTKTPPEGEEWPNSVEFTEFPSKGWMGFCGRHNENIDSCWSDSNVRGVALSPMSYNTFWKIFVYHMTNDIATDPMEESIDAWLYSYFPWTYSCYEEYEHCPTDAPPTPSVDTVMLILENIGASNTA